MINKTEIDLKSKEFEIHPANVERDYIFGWIIFGIFTVSELRQYIFLKGGNALRKGYFQNTRFSSDLDFGIPGDIDSDTLLTEINKVCDFIQEKTGVTFVKDSNCVEEKFTVTEAPITGLRVFEAKVFFNDFYGKPGHVKIKIVMDITRFDKVLLPIQTVNLIHPYSDASEVSCQIKCMKLEEIIATKLKCLMQRQHAPDLYDYVYSIKLLGGNLNKNEVVQALVQKTIFRRNPQMLKRILSKTPFDYFRSSWEKSLICAKQFIIGVEESISIFISDLESLFGIYPDNGYEQFTFFSPELRVPIMQAGRERTLLKIVYNHAERMVEPYALKFMEKRSGQEREYLYVFNQSGGSNPPGIRSLVAEGFQSIENTDQKFTPQFPVELSKAGEAPEVRYLFDPNKPIQAPRTNLGIRRSRRLTGLRIKYVYKCTYCGKSFSKSTMNSTLNSHKNKTGYPCSGRHGYYIRTKY